MLVDEQYRKATSFLYEDEVGSDKRRPCGTVFLVSVEITSEIMDVYAVTARHVIVQSWSKRTLYFRAPKINGGYIDIALQHKNWYQHPKTDVALIPIELPKNVDVKVIPHTHLADNDFLKRHNVGEGDEVFFIGLFSQHFGTKKPLPIIRFGNIALMPLEPVRIIPEPGTQPIEVEAYLVEARSWGGQSGSPTFVHFPPNRIPGVLTLPEYPVREPHYHLLGLVSGHYDIRQNINLDDNETDLIVSQNSGIGVVIPANYILEILQWEELRDRRSRLISNS